MGGTVSIFRIVGIVTLLALTGFSLSAEPSTPREVSGIYPHLAMFNREGECGTGAVVPFAGRLWVVTYAPHAPKGSSDKLYEITPDLQQIVREESLGGTPANRMIHRESEQLFIGPYVIDRQRQVRVIPYSRMFGRPTGNARHLFDPAHKIYCATMEEGLYEIDVHSLQVQELWADEQQRNGRHADLPGYHGKGLYSGQGRILYANNGDHAREALSNPAVPSGVLAEWDGQASRWTIVRRNQFTEITGPGGIEGSAHPETDPVWSIGWDHRSLILQVLQDGTWKSFRLPKGSHSYDGAHGWNTEWPRIRDIGEDSLLMTMHGTFWKFPRTFAAPDCVGIEPLSNYLKVVGDFCRWEDRIVLGCDDTARNEFLNKRVAKSGLAGPGQSQSNLWFLKPEQLGQFGPALGRGAVWCAEPVTAGIPSDPFLFSGYDHRTIFLTTASENPCSFELQVDRDGTGNWTPLRTVTFAGTRWEEFTDSDTGTWIRLIPKQNSEQVSAVFHYRNRDSRSVSPATMFEALARLKDRNVTGGLLFATGGERKTARFLATLSDGSPQLYELDGALNLKAVTDSVGADWMREHVAIGPGNVDVDDASVIYRDDAGRRWRLPRGSESFTTPEHLRGLRVCREVCTERDLFNAQGIFYELPAENAGGFAKIRPVTTHNCVIQDYCSYRGLMLISGLRDHPAASDHVVVSDDGRAALWIGAADDLWQLGKPRGLGGPWKQSAVMAGVPSDPYLMTGFDRKQLTVSTTDDAVISIEVDITGDGEWFRYSGLQTAAGSPATLEFPDRFSAYWVRLVTNRDTVATATFLYD